MDFELHSQDRPYIENAGFFDRNQIPRANERRGEFWTWVGGLLGLPERPSVMVDKDDGGRPFITSLDGGGTIFGGTMDYDARLAAMRRREAELARLNGMEAAGPTVTASDLVREAVTHIAEAIKELRPRDRAKHWLMAVLSGGPMLAELVKEKAKAEGISGRTLRRAFEAGNFGHAKNADGRSVWSQPQAGQTVDGH